MKTQVIRSLLAFALTAVPGAIQAQPDAHYVPGIEGIKCATLPPPGFYFRDYNVFYYADQVNNGAGNSVGPNNFEALTYANVPRAIWITKTKILGGNVGGDVVLPLIYNSVKAGTFKSSTAGIGDAYAEGTLSWHPGQVDIGAAVGLWVPTGASGKPTSTGNGYWTPEITLGATWYPVADKSWAISALNRYEFNSESRDSHVTPGQAWTLEYGISKTVTKTIDCGVVGYFQTRTTASTGNQPLAGTLFPYSRVAAVGPEVNFEFPVAKFWMSLRYNYEFMAENRAQGHTVAVTLTKAF